MCCIIPHLSTSTYLEEESYSNLTACYIHEIEYAIEEYYNISLLYANVKKLCETYLFTVSEHYPNQIPHAEHIVAKYAFDSN